MVILWIVALGIVRRRPLVTLVAWSRVDTVPGNGSPCPAKVDSVKKPSVQELVVARDITRDFGRHSENCEPC